MGNKGVYGVSAKRIDRGVVAGLGDGVMCYSVASSGKAYELRFSGGESEERCYQMILIFCRSRSVMGIVPSVDRELFKSGVMEVLKKSLLECCQEIAMLGYRVSKISG